MKRLIVLLALFVPGAAFADAESAEKPPISDETQPKADHKAHAGTPYFPNKTFRFGGNPFDHYGKDATGGKFGDGVMIDPKTNQPMVGHHGELVEEPMSPPFWAFVLNFVLFFALLAKFGAPAAKKLAAERHDQIKTALDEAAKLRKDAQGKLAEYENKLKQADAEISKLVEGMRADAEADKKRILEAAERQAAQLNRDAETRIAAEIDAARAALRKEVSAAATVAAEKVVREALTAADQSKAINTFIADVQSVAKEARR
jgi:ATP synthase F0 subunit b